MIFFNVSNKKIKFTAGFFQTVQAICCYIAFGIIITLEPNKVHASEDICFSGFATETYIDSNHQNIYSNTKTQHYKKSCHIIFFCSILFLVMAKPSAELVPHPLNSLLDSTWNCCLLFLPEIM